MSLDMRAAVFRKDYRQPDYWIREVALEFDLLPEATKVTARLSVQPNAAGTAGAPMVLDGADVRLGSLSLAGRVLAATANQVGQSSPSRSDERRVGKEWFSHGRCRGSPEH